MFVPDEESDIHTILELGATTWRVLVWMLASGEPVGARELSRALNLSSHSVGLYHLNKLIDYEIVEKNNYGDYVVRDDADLGFLDNFMFIGFRVIPRVLLFAVMITTLLFIYLVFVGPDLGIHSVFAATLGVLSAIFLWSEVYRIWSGIR
ncbi:MAG: hypothetical protein GF309_13295 [Candidatus Lokiarchaeota archaeon]|nr:hypothetical protein [Candidatus Lokiarchaeota archaeon]